MSNGWTDMSNKTLKILMMSSSYTEDFTPFYNSFFEQVGSKLGVTIEYETISWYHAPDIISERLKSDNPPDLFQLGSTWVSAYANIGFLDQVPSSFPEYEPLADWLEEICISEGEKICLPWLADTIMLFANRKHILHMHIDEKDLSTTEGLLETCHNILDS